MHALTAPHMHSLHVTRTHDSHCKAPRFTGRGTWKPDVCLRPRAGRDLRGLVYLSGPGVRGAIYYKFSLRVRTPLPLPIHQRTVNYHSSSCPCRGRWASCLSLPRHLVDDPSVLSPADSQGPLSGGILAALDWPQTSGLPDPPPDRSRIT